ncbi:hypothetical protein [Tenacibaculum soleae]|uniref:hypothetical protein n=1 Tax=Tenacibaculum soleae TaxID=447689 RepID=UPI0023009F15|nr:hypothetical protein [Tenacibaculum soleae]
MKKYEFKNASYSQSIKDGDDCQLLAFSNESPNALLKVEHKRESGTDIKLFTDLKVGYLLEAQNKILALLNEKPVKTFEVLDGKIKTSVIDLAFGGEINILTNESIDFSVKNSSATEQSPVIARAFEGYQVSPYHYVVKKQTFKKENTQKEIDLSTADFLVFDVLPDEIEIRAKGQKIVRDKESILIDQADNFGVVAFDSEIAVLGSKYAKVIDVRGVESVYLEQEDATADLVFHTVKIPF